MSKRISDTQGVNAFKRVFSEQMNLLLEDATLVRSDVGILNALKENMEQSDLIARPSRKMVMNKLQKLQQFEQADVAQQDALTTLVQGVYERAYTAAYHEKPKDLVKPVVTTEEVLEAKPEIQWKPRYVKPLRQAAHKIANDSSEDLSVNQRAALKSWGSKLGRIDNPSTVNEVIAPLAFEVGLTEEESADLFDRATQIVREHVGVDTLVQGGSAMVAQWVQKER